MSHIKSYVELYGDFAAKLRKKHTYGDAYVIESPSLGTEVSIKGVKGKVVNFNWLDYLALGNYPAVKDYAIECINKHGIGTISSRVLADSLVHQELERSICDYKGSEGCVIMPTGYSATNALISLIVNDMVAGSDRMKGKLKPLVFVDKLSHASILDALLPFKHGKDAKAEVVVFEHLDYQKLQHLLEQSMDQEVDRFIVTDALFSMNGSFADVNKLLFLAKQFNAIIVLDNAHCDGVYGDEGKGVLSFFNVEPEDEGYFFQCGTFSKSFASTGGYMALPYALCDLIRVSQWKYIFSAALSTANVATLINNLKLIRGEEGDRRRIIIANSAQRLLSELKKREFNTLNSESHVIPVVIGKVQKCLEVQQYLMEEENILVGAARFPAAEMGKALCRIAITAEHSDEHIENLINALVRARDKYSF